MSVSYASVGGAGTSPTERRCSSRASRSKSATSARRTLTLRSRVKTARNGYAISPGDNAPVAVACVAGRLALPQLVLFGDELLDRRVDLWVVHLSSFEGANRLRKASAVSATSRHPLSMTSACPRPVICTISVTPEFFDSF